MNIHKQLVAELRVFVNSDGEYGNSAGVVVDENNNLSDAERCKIALSTGFSECVFINDVLKGKVSIYNPQNEISFSGHALVGAAYYITHFLKANVSSMETKAGDVFFRSNSHSAWITSGLHNTPPWNHVELPDTSKIDALQAKNDIEHTMYWTWSDKTKGLIRARTFAPDWGIPEDEANGSGSMQLANHLHQSLEVHHGIGSIVYARPVTLGVVELGGNVTPKISMIEI